MQVTSKNIKLLTLGKHRVETNLFLRVTNTSRIFIFRYQIAGTRRDISLGQHPTVTVTVAKQEAAKCRALLARGIDPLEVRQQNRQDHSIRQITFGKYLPHALETIFNLRRLAPATRRTWEHSLANHALPVLKDIPVCDMTVQDVCEVLNPIWESKTTLASRIRNELEAIFTLAKREGIFIGENPAVWKGNLEAFFPLPSRVNTPGHNKAFTVEALAEQVQKSLGQERTVHKEFVFGALTATRQIEFNYAKWEEIDFKNAIWTIPPERRKDRKPEPFPVPLSVQAIQLLQSMPVESEFIFPGYRNKKRPLADHYVSMYVNTMSGGTATMHGCRSTFRDWCSIEGIDTAVAEKCLMHSLRSVQAAYQRDDLLERRRPVMQAWADTIMPKKK